MKEAFERHIIDIARKAQKNDDDAVTLHEEMDERCGEYRKDMEALQERLPEADTLPLLTALERQALDSGTRLREASKRTGEKLQALVKFPETLKTKSEPFKNMIKKNREYTSSEIAFYMREIENLDSELDKKAMVLAERLSRLTSEVEVRVEEPLKAFKERYRQAEDTLCAAKGYGRRYGEPRRKAQERCRTLIARASNVRQNIQDLFDYLTSLTECTVDDPVEAARLPLCPKFQLRLSCGVSVSDTCGSRVTGAVCSWMCLGRGRRVMAVEGPGSTVDPDSMWTELGAGTRHGSLHGPFGNGQQSHSVYGWMEGEGRTQWLHQSESV